MKKIKSAKLHNKRYIYGALLALLIAGTWFIKSLFVTPNIALVAETKPACVSNIASFSMTNSCAADPYTFQSVETKCLDGRVLKEGDGKTCISQVEAYKRAQTFCGSKCTPTETSIPRPSTTPPPAPTSTAVPYPSPSIPSSSTTPGTPPPTSDPSPLVTCETETYRLPANINVSQITKDSLQQYLVNPALVVVAPGEKIAFNLRLTNAKPYPLVGGMLNLRAWTSVLNLPQEPFKLLSQSPGCTTQGDGKTIHCNQTQFELGVGQSAHPNMFFVAEVTTTSSNAINIMYQGYHSYSPFSCAPVTVKVSPPQNNPDLCAQEYGTCVTKTNACLTYSDSCAKADFCATPFKSCGTVSPTPKLTPTPTRRPIYRWNPRYYINRYYQTYQCRISCSRESKANTGAYCSRRCQ